MVKAPRTQYVDTVWEMRTYDVWGNPRDGYEVNDSFRHSDIALRLKLETHNAGTPHEFKSATPSDKQLREVFGVRCRLETDGDDLTIYVNRERDGYPIGELRCLSHDSLSPPRVPPCPE